MELIQFEKVVVCCDCESRRTAALPWGCRPRNGPA